VRKFSVIIPTYNHAHFLVGAIESVLNQTCQDFEIIVVDDASSDDTSQVISRFNDPRLHYLVHPHNMGLSATRNTGIKAATGNLIAFLDADDWFHPEKLELHADYLQRNPDVGVTYNARYELNHSSKTIRAIWRPPAKVGLSDFVLGFPFAPSDIVVRKECAFKAGLLDERYMFYGEDLYFNCMLAMSGCGFVSVDRVLNYRRYHSDKKFGNISDIVKVMLDVLDRVFNDPRCPVETMSLKNAAYAHYYLWYGIFALSQSETILGQSYLKEAVRLKPSLVEGTPCQLLHMFMDYSVTDDSIDHKVLLNKLTSQLPVELSWLSDNYDWAVARGYLLRGTRAVMWDRMEEGRFYFAQALTHSAQIDNPFLRRVSAQVIDYEAEFGPDAAQTVLDNLSPFLEKIGGRADVNWLKGCYAVNIGFKNYAAGDYSKVPRAVFHAILNDPSYLSNRGVIKILINSLVNRVGRRRHAF
jgi:glycosyltransferase involved in cell wall biosynthesis